MFASRNLEARAALSSEGSSRCAFACLIFRLSISRLRILSAEMLLGFKI